MGIGQGPPCGPGLRELLCWSGGEPMACPLASSTSPAVSEQQQPALLPGRPGKETLSSISEPGCQNVSLQGKREKQGVREGGGAEGVFEMSLVFFAIF